MPELPEVETVRLQLCRKVIGKTITKVTVFHPKTPAHDTTFKRRLKNKRIDSIDRVGKLLIFNFIKESDLHMLAHLKMTGQFIFVDPKGKVAGGGHTMTSNDSILPHQHTRVAFHFSDGSSLFFNDMRLFGYTKLVTNDEMVAAKKNYGPEPIDPEFDLNWFAEKVRRRQTSIKAVLLTQGFVSGLGNIYVDEALWRGRVKPMRTASTLTKKEATLLGKASGDVMRESITVGGTTFQHFKDTGGDNGNFTDYLQVFGKQNTPCSRCGTLIKKTRCAGRGTHYCPGCQK